MIETPDVSTKNCPICAQQLPLSEFGVCRSRKDGRNLYCKSCIRKKVTDSRKALKEYRSSRKRYVSPSFSDGALVEGEQSGSPRILRKMSPVERVREAIRSGARTQKEIRKGANLGDDEVGDALANLLLWTREIRTELVNNERLYFINESVVEPTTYRDHPQVPQRKRDVPSSFSALQGLMPGKNPEGETEKIGGWVAA
ncbi:MAG TPA: hypothetical protein VJU86_15660 [Pyrinomonadaceae bacterium]|nr:hypothetical protein [Pyrinomonadaceae bacterium]